MKSKTKFTLLELVIVFAIIGILITLLLPSLRNAKEAAYTAVCLSNQKQVSSGVNLFVANNAGKYPDTYNETGRWNVFVDALINSSDPSNQNFEDHNQSASSFWYCPTLVSSPGFNNGAVGRPLSTHGGFNHLLGGGPVAGGTIREGIFASSLEYPARTMLISDSQHFVSARTSSEGISVHTGQGNNTMAFRHGAKKGINISFSDGHASLTSKSKAYGRFSELSHGTWE